MILIVLIGDNFYFKDQVCDIVDIELIVGLLMIVFDEVVKEWIYEFLSKVKLDGLVNLWDVY